MTGGAPSVPLANRRDLALTRVFVSLMVLMTALIAVTVLAEDSGLPPRMVLLLTGAVSAPVIGALVWSGVRRWRDRVEVWPDRAVWWRGERQEEAYWRDLASTRARLGGGGGLFGGEAFGVEVDFGDQRSFTVEGASQGEIAPLLRALNEEMLKRWYGTLRQGGEVACRDRARFPWSRAAWMTVVAAAVVAALALGDLSALANLLRGVMVLLSAWRGSWRAMSTWWRAKKAGGVRLSSEGIRAWSEPEGAALAAAPYREAQGAAGWTPWSMVESASVDGYCMEIRCRDRAEPLVLSGGTENLFVVYELLRVMFSGGTASFPRPD